jgi:hypothetical protein
MQLLKMHRLSHDMARKLAQLRSKASTEMPVASGVGTVLLHGRVKVE